jgi:F0F1-type ATP synthase epsilon subunit
MAEEQKKETPQDAADPQAKVKSKGKEQSLGATSVHVKLYSPFKVYFDDEAKSVSAENATGPFDVLPQHHRFITLLNPCEITIRPVSGEDKRIRINRGVMHVRQNSITVFLDV